MYPLVIEPFRLLKLGVPHGWEKIRALRQPIRAMEAFYISICFLATNGVMHLYLDQSHAKA